MVSSKDGGEISAMDKGEGSDDIRSEWKQDGTNSSSDSDYGNPALDYSNRVIEDD